MMLNRENNLVTFRAFDDVFFFSPLYSFNTRIFLNILTVMLKHILLRLVHPLYVYLSVFNDVYM